MRKAFCFFKERFSDIKSLGNLIRKEKLILSLACISVRRSSDTWFSTELRFDKQQIRVQRYKAHYHVSTQSSSVRWGVLESSCKKSLLLSKKCRFEEAKARMRVRACVCARARVCACVCVSVLCAKKGKENCLQWTRWECWL